MDYGLYIHIPYCRSRCRYCDFYTCPGSRAVPQAYIDALLRDFARYAPKGADGAPLPPKTVYFGGGTPGLLAAEQVQRLLDAARPAPGAEVTLEVNPEDADEDRLAAFLHAGVNRLSLGVQTASDESLKRLGRLHTAQKAAEALAGAQRAGFKNISCDVMLALPQYTQREFDETLALVRAGGATHLSAYLLKLEAGTAFGKNPPEGLPGPDEAADMYLYAVKALEDAGYRQYEISNFALPGFEGRHNLIYWDAGNWLGLGPAAHSSLTGRRFSFGADVAACIADESPPAGEGALTAEDYMMLRLRLRAGLEEAALRARFGQGFTEGQHRFFAQLCQGGLAERRSGGYALTPRGMLVQNTVLARLFGEG